VVSIGATSVGVASLGIVDGFPSRGTGPIQGINFPGPHSKGRVGSWFGEWPRQPPLIE
jgi:hypothetical protein